MNVILLEKLGRLGGIGDQVRVKAGYGRNFLLPFGKAVVATPENVAAFEARRSELERSAADKKLAAEQRGARLAQLTVTIAANAGDEGKLFGSIGPRDVADAITKAGVEVSKSEVRMPTGPLRELGEYMLDIQLHSDVMQAVKITVIPE